MADEQSTDPTPEVEAQITDSEIDEDFDLLDDTEETETEDTSSEEAPADSTEESDDTSEQSDDESDDDTDDSESDEQSEDSEDDSNEEDTASEELSPDDRKKYNDEMAKRRIAEKQLRQERDGRRQDNINRYLKEAEDNEVEYQKRLIEVEALNVQQERIQLNSDRLETELQRAVNDIDLFRNADPDIKEELYAAVDEFEANNVVKDEYGNPVKINGNVYEYLQKKADSIRRIEGVGARRASKAKTETKSRTVTPPSKTPKTPKSDDALAGFDEEANRWQSPERTNSMAINMASKFEKKTSELLKAKRKTESVVNNDFSWDGVNAINVYTLTDPSMGSYDSNGGSSRYGNPTEVEDTIQTWTLARDRAWTKTIDKLNYQDTQEVRKAGKYLAQATKNVLVPEMDTYIIQTIVTAGEVANRDDIATDAATTAANAYTDFTLITADISNQEAPEDGRVALMTPSYYNFLKSSGFVLDSDSAYKDRKSGDYGSVDGCKVVIVPSNRMPANTNLVITHPSVTVAPEKLVDYTLHDNPPGVSGQLLEYRHRYDAFVDTNKTGCIGIHKTAQQFLTRSKQWH